MNRALRMHHKPRQLSLREWAGHAVTVDLSWSAPAFMDDLIPTLKRKNREGSFKSSAEDNSDN